MASPAISPASAAPTNVTPNSLEPTFGYAISASPTAARVTQGQSVTLEVLVDWFAGAPQPVTLSVWTYRNLQLLRRLCQTTGTVISFGSWVTPCSWLENAYSVAL